MICIVQRFVKEFCSSLQYEKDYSLHTLISYQKDLDQFQDYLSEYYGRDVRTDDSILKDIDTLAVRGFLNHLHRLGMDRGSAARKLAAVRSFFRFLCRQNYVSHNCARAVRTPKQNRKLVSVLPREEMERLLEHSFEDTPVGRRDRAIFEILYATGLRVGELTNMTLRDLDMEMKTISVVGKGRKERIVLFGDKAARAIRSYLETRPQLVHGEDTGFVFLNLRGRRLSETRVRQILRQHVKRVAMQRNVTPHIFRHSFATHLLNSGADLRFIQELLGHSSLSTTQKYAHLNIDQLLKTYSKAHPRK